MGGPSWVDWSLAGAVWALLLLGAAAALWALFADRARGRRRCPKCWYDLAGLTGMGCPECGYNARGEHHLFRTRRRTRLAAAAVLVGVTPAVIWTVLSARSGAWAAYVPTSVLVVAVNPQKFTYYDMSDPMTAELNRRLNRGPLWGWQSQVLIDRVMATHMEVLPIVHARERWPLGEPLSVSGSTNLTCFVATPWADSVTARVRLLRTAGGGVGEWVDGKRAGLYDIESLGVPDPGPGPVRVEVELIGDRRVLWSGVRELDVDRSAPIETVLAPLTNPEIDRAVAAALEPSVTGKNPGRVLLFLREPDRRLVFHRYVAVGIKVRLLHDGKVVGQTHHVMQAERHFLIENPGGLAVLALNTSVPVTPDTGVWEVEVEGDRSTALRDYNRYGWDSTQLAPWVKEPTEYWAGCVRVPLTFNWR